MKLPLYPLVAIVSAAALAALAMSSVHASKSAPPAGPLGAAHVQSRDATKQQLTTRIVLKMKQQDAAMARVYAETMADMAQISTASISPSAGGKVAITLPKAVPLAQAYAYAARLARDPQVVYAEPDIWIERSQAALNDTFASQQWNLGSPQNRPGATGLLAAWPTAATRTITVAVIDTGSVAHIDMGLKEVPGFDFISDPSIAGDSNARDADPSDPGDACESRSTPSSWHGLRVAGLIGAVHNNAYGIAGAASPVVRISHARVLGKCGGWLSDAADAVLWAAGAPVSGVPANAWPARVINMSLGGQPGTACPAYLQDAITEANRRGAVVVAAAGNAGESRLGPPATCEGVIAAGAHTASGDLTSYSNRGPGLTLTAPGGGACAKQAGACDQTPPLSLSNAGTTAPGSPEEAAYFVGTSAAAPHVSAAAALLLSQDPTLTASRIYAVLSSTARPHAPDSWCAASPGACGAGMLDALAATQAIAVPVLTVSPASQMVGPSKEIILQASLVPARSFAITWQQLSGAPVNLQDMGNNSVRFITPAGKSEPITVRATASGRLATGQEQSVSAQAVIEVNTPPNLALPSAISATAGKPFELALQPSDPDGDAVTVSVLKGPSGLVATTSVLSWAAPIAGTYSIELLVSDRPTPGPQTSVTVSTTLTVQGGAGPIPGSPEVPAPSASGSGGCASGGSGRGIELIAMLFAAVFALVFRQPSSA